MSHEQSQPPAPKEPFEIFGLTDQEKLDWRVSGNRFQSILNDEKTIIHRMEESENNYGEFLFVTASRPGATERVAMTFFGLGYHDYRERWLTDEWFWYQSNTTSELLEEEIDKQKAKEILHQRMDEIGQNFTPDIQTDRGRFFELLADLTDEDGAIAEMEDLDAIGIWIFAEPVLNVPRQTKLLTPEIKEKLPGLYSGEDRGLDALAQVKYFTPDSNWTWYASEFDGEDTFFGLVSGFGIEFGYFSLKELEEARGPLGLQIERDLKFEPQTLRELQDYHLRKGKGIQIKMARLCWCTICTPTSNFPIVSKLYKPGRFQK